MAKPVEMPYSLEAEQSLLGCILIDQELQSEIVTEIEEGDFYRESHKIVCSAMKKIAGSGKPVDFVTLSDELDGAGSLQKAGGIEYLTQLTTVTPSAANYRTYLEIVKRDSVRRKLIRSAAEIDRYARENTDKSDALAFAEKKVFDISAEVETGALMDLAPTVSEILDKFNTIANDPTAFRGVPTGFTELDDITNGLHPSELIVVAARPAMGKTSFAMNIVEHCAVFEKKVCAVFSLEMPREQIAQRLVCSLAGVSMARATKGQLEGEEWQRLWKANKQLSEAKIFVEDSSIVTCEEILSKCRRLKMQHGLDLIMIDYIQLMTGNRGRENRQQEVSEISRNLKILAMELKVPVVALSQLNRSVESSARPDHRPQLSDLRESGSIEQDASIVMFIHRPDKYMNEKEIESGAVERNVAEIILAKHRNGGLGTVKLYFKGESTKFMNMTKGYTPPQTAKEQREDVRADVAAELNAAYDEAYKNGDLSGDALKNIPAPGDNQAPAATQEDELFG
ncbi:MAG: replicative DNA helicase [Clostridiales bacterium]|nr:replicative DNA helicase [Clostridiales bacterium]